MVDDRVFRAGVLVVILALLTGLFILGGTDWPASPTVGPDPIDIDEDPAEFIDEEVYLSGELVDGDELLVEVEHEEDEFMLELEELPADEVEAGDEISFGGELRSEGVVEVHRFAVRDPWETRYMYTVSMLGAIFALLYGLNAWQVDFRELAFEPRDRTLIDQFRQRGSRHG